MTALRGIELTGRRRRVRTILVMVIAVGAALAAFGFGLGNVRVPHAAPGTHGGWGEWESYAVLSWFVPLLASLAVFGWALAVRRGRPFSGTILGAATLAAIGLMILTEPDEVVFAIDVIAEVGYYGAILMTIGGAALLVVEPVAARRERRARA